MHAVAEELVQAAAVVDVDVEALAELVGAHDPVGPGLRGRALGGGRVGGVGGGGTGGLRAGHARTPCPWRATEHPRGERRG
ncbi:MAG: hypothetical protein ACK559_24770, partial [bacterium]